MTRPLNSLAALAAIALLGCNEPSAQPEAPAATEQAAVEGPEGENAAGLDAYKTVYSVLTHPRCMNCHPAGDRPLQYDDSKPHAMNVQRGKDDAGRIGMRCTTCHGKANRELPHQPPGSPVWRLAPKEQAFQGRSPRTLALQLKDKKQSHMTPEELHAHVKDDALVGWGWNPGPGRKAIPVSRKKFVDAFKAWVDAGMPAPEETK